ncbi:exopolysaccharide biosynthesis protein [Luteimonas sp. R10]|uniref:exopolysaccharide biosynthesis protein n=1 Tax=Luteimonas sp. R10 TaxID=3108176 RepID=UPI0030875857|nr:exopolysaccharide biosynthesis protein [Luteimonas sp. R10]
MSDSDELPAPVATVAGLEELLERLAGSARQAGHVSVAEMLAAAGQRSFGPLLLVPGLIVLSPLSGVPGLPSAVAVLVLLVAVQLLCRRRHVWLPQWTLRRSVSARLLQRAVRVLRPVARVVDRLTRPRLRMLADAEGPALYPIALLCILIALTMPPLELVPFANSIAGAALTAFGLALITRDGLLALVAGVLCAAGFWFAASGVLSLA